MSRKWFAQIIILSFVISGLLYYTRVLDRISNIFYDTLLKITANKPESHFPVVLITATEKFTQQIGHEPNRNDYANLINLLSDCKLIVSDIFFPSRQSEETDRVLGNSLAQNAEKIILPVFTPYKLKKNLMKPDTVLTF